MIESTFRPDESLRLITEMIEKTRKGISDKSQYFLIWGWGAFLACIAQFILKVILDNPFHYQVWWVTVPCIILTIIVAKRNRQKERVKTFVSETMTYLWSALGATFLVMSVLFSKFGWQYCYPFFIMIYGVGTFISGRLLRFTPLVLGGTLCWIFAVACAWLEYDYQILLTAMALLVSYIIPGHLLRIKSKKEE